MIIRRLTLHNFGVYSGSNTLEFSNKKPVVLIGGMNGRGKTTILNAILIALYGSNSFAYKDSNYRTYGQYLKSLVNTSDDTNDCFIEIEFLMEQKNKDVYSVKRSWNAISPRIKEEIIVKKNYVADDFLTQNWAMFIESLIPSALSQYFFFDGDNIAELAVAKSDKKMKESIRALLGITVVDQLGTDIERVATRARGKTIQKRQAVEIEKAQQEKERLEGELEDVDDEMESINKDLVKARSDLEKANADYVVKGGGIAEKRQELIDERIRINAILQQIDVQLVDIASTELPLSLTEKFIKEIALRVEEEKEEKSIQDVAAQLRVLFKEYKRESSDVDDFIAFVESKANAAVKEAVFGGSEELNKQVTYLLGGGLDKRRQQARDLLEERNELRNKLGEIEEHLATDIDEKEIHKAYAKIKRIEQLIIEKEEILNRLERKRSEINGQTIRATSNYNRIVEGMIKDIEMNSDAERVVVYSEIAQKILNEYKVRLQQEKISQLTKTIIKCYKQLSNKSNMISRVDMDPDTLDLSYWNKEGVLVPKSSLSEGEKQMMIISILWALATCSKRKLPVIIDTPLARLDSSHRMAMISKYFPKASEQTIILSTDSEITGEYYNALSRYTSDEFTLIYDDEKRSSRIEKGYFGRKE